MSSDLPPPAALEEPAKVFLRYDEVALKGGSRPQFEKRLKINALDLLNTPGARIQRIRGRHVLLRPEDLPLDTALARLERCFGVRKISPVWSTACEPEALLEKAVAIAGARFAAGDRVFKVEARRNYKAFPWTSRDINNRLGQAIRDRVPGLEVDVHRPDFQLTVEVFKQEIYLYPDSANGPGGLPMGASGRALALLSGGIDSPAAAWLSQKRGLHVDAVYFHSFPFTGEKTKDKVKELARILSTWSPAPLNLYIASATELQQAIQAAVPEPYWTLMLRRFMLRVADELADRKKVRALVTGDCLAQVASQTVKNLNALEGVTRRVVLRPLLGYDKYEVVDLATRIGTYETSVLPFQDCCTLFAPEHPTTKGERRRCESLEARMDTEQLVRRSVAGIELVRFRLGEAEDRPAPFAEQAPAAEAAKSRDACSEPPKS